MDWVSFTTFCSLANHCSPYLEYLMVKSRPCYLPREFTSAILIAVAFPPQADVKIALDLMYAATNRIETKFPEALFIVADDFNQANLRKVLPKFHQHASGPTSGPNILDHCYTTIKNAYRSIPRPHFGKSDHSAVFLFPAYKQKLKLENPTAKATLHWSKEAEDRLRDCLGSVDWPVFKSAAENLNENATTVTDFISKCVADCLPEMTVRMFPNRKPWMNKKSTPC